MKSSYPFQISMNYAEVVHVLQAVRNASQLKGTSVRLPRGQGRTHKFGTVHTPVSLDELIDIPVFHPLGNKSETVFVQHHSKKR